VGGGGTGKNRKGGSKVEVLVSRNRRGINRLGKANPSHGRELPPRSICLGEACMGGALEAGLIPDILNEVFGISRTRNSRLRCNLIPRTMRTFRRNVRLRRCCRQTDVTLIDKNQAKKRPLSQVRENEHLLKYVWGIRRQSKSTVKKIFVRQGALKEEGQGGRRR